MSLKRPRVGFRCAPIEACRIVKTAMAREKKDRYARAAELAEEVDDYLKSLG